MEVRTKPAMCKGKLRSVLVGAFSVGLAISAFSGLELGAETGNATAVVQESKPAPPDIVGSSTPMGDIVWASTSTDDIVWGALSTDDIVWNAVPADSADSNAGLSGTGVVEA
ncbi:hypothetical protein [Streptomyces sp. NPDC003032]